MLGDITLTNARRIGEATAVDVQLRDGVVARVTWAGESAPIGEPVDLGGRFVLPGLWDQHVHFAQWALARRRFDASGADSAAAFVALVGRLLGERGPEDAGAPLVGFGFRDALWSDAPDLAALDAVSGDTPVAAMSADLHGAILNTAALARYGFAGHPTGVLREHESFRLQVSLGEASPEERERWVADAARDAARRGVVGVVDMNMAWGFDDWTRREAEGLDALRVRVGIYPQDLDRAVSLGLRTGQRMGRLVEVGPLKVIADGSLNTRTAYCEDPYPGVSGADAHGVLNLDPAELERLMGVAAGAGIVPAVHAIGDRANTIVLDAFERVGVGGRLEHAQLVAEEDVPRFARLGVVASVQPWHAIDDDPVIAAQWPHSAGRAYPFRSLIASGAELVFGSDAPVAPLDPWLAMDAALADGGRVPWQARQGVTRAQALAASVDGHPGVVPGAVADLVVVDADPLDAGTALAEVSPAATLVGGRFTWRSGELG